MRPIMMIVGLALGVSTASAAELGLLDKIAIRNACAADMKALCGAVEPGDGRLRACLAERASHFSDNCRSVLARYAHRLDPSTAPER